MVGFVSALGLGKCGPCGYRSRQRRFPRFNVRMQEKASVKSQEREENLLDACESAVEDYVESGMVVGIVSESIAGAIIDKLYRLIGTKKLVDVSFVPASAPIRKRLEELDMNVLKKGDLRTSDLAFVHPLQVDPELNFIPSTARRSLLRQRLVISGTDSVVLVSTEEAERERLSNRISIEINKYGADYIARRLVSLPSLRQLSATAVFRTKDDQILTTLDGNLVVDMTIGSVKSLTCPAAISEEISAVTGVVAHDLYVDVADKLIIGARDAILEKYPNSLSHGVMETDLTQQQIDERLSALDDWQMAGPTSLFKSYSLANSQRSSAFAKRLLRTSAKMEVNVDLNISSGQVVIRLDPSKVRSRHVNFIDEAERLFLEVEEHSMDAQ